MLAARVVSRLGLSSLGFTAACRTSGKWSRPCSTEASGPASEPAAGVRVRHSSVYKTLSYMDAPGRRVWLLGTAHISNMSAREVRQVAESANPDVVFVELCGKRLERLKEDVGKSDEEPPSISEVLSEAMDSKGPIMYRIFTAALKAHQAALAKVFHLRPGGEFIAAIEVAQTRGVPIVCGDREIDETVSRLKEAFMKDWWSLLTTWEGESLPSLLGDPQEGVERLRDRQAMRRIRAALQARSPNILQVMLHERDELMAQRLLSCGGERVLAVVGAAHMDGIEERWLQRAGRDIE